MKRINLFVLMLVGLTFVSCSTWNYQVYEVKTDLTQKENSLVFENEDCKVSYNLWSNRGSVSFIFENKSDKDIFVDMTQSFFIKNGNAHDYYMNRIFNSYSYDAVNVGYNYTISSGASLSRNFANLYAATIGDTYGIGAQVGAKKGYAAGFSIKEAEYVCIPAKSYKYIGGYAINPDFIRSCERNMYKPKVSYTLSTYNEADSPLRFTNRIAYSYEESNKSLKFIDNSFWLTSVKNYSYKGATEKVIKTDMCDSRYRTKEREFKIGGPNKFYVLYKTN